MEVKCNNCDFIGDNDSLYLIETLGDGTETVVAYEDPYGHITRLLESSSTPFFFLGCPNCLTDDYLMDIDE